MESNTRSQHQGDEIVIAATSSALLLGPCVINLAHATQDDGPLMLIRMEDGAQLVLSARAALNLAEAADQQHSRGKSLLVDVTPRDAELAKGGSRGISVECHVDTLLNRRLAAIRAAIALQLTVLGLTEEQVDTVLARCVGEVGNHAIAPELKFGGAVWLKSGGPEMKVAHIADSEGHTVVACTWPGEAGRLEIANYRADQLSTVPVKPSCRLNHTLIDDFEHMLAYTGLSAEPGEIRAKLLRAFAEGRGESIPVEAPKLTEERRKVYAGVAETIAETGRNLGMSDTSISQVTEQLTDGPAK